MSSIPGWSSGDLITLRQVGVSDDSSHLIEFIVDMKGKSSFSLVRWQRFLLHTLSLIKLQYAGIDIAISF
jgi:hypothetical protein